MKLHNALLYTCLAAGGLFVLHGLLSRGALPAGSRVAASDPQWSPDSTAFSYALNVEEYVGMLDIPWTGFHPYFTFKHVYEIHVYDFRRRGAPRRIARWALAPGESPALDGWDDVGIVVLALRGDPTSRLVVDPRSGWRHELPGAAQDSALTRLRRRAAWSNPGNSLGTRRLDLIAGEYFLWDPVRRERELLVSLPRSFDWLPDPAYPGGPPGRRERRNADAIEQLGDVSARHEGDSTVVRLVTFVPRPGDRARAYDLLVTILLPDTMRGALREYSSKPQELETVRYTLGPGATTIERAYSDARIAAIVRPYLARSGAEEAPTWGMNLAFTLKTVPRPAGEDPDPPIQYLGTSSIDLPETAVPVRRVRSPLRTSAPARPAPPPIRNN